MKLSQYFSILLVAFIITLSMTTTTQAATFYRHLPFHIAMKPDDTLIVEYDMTTHTGLSCIAHDSGLRAKFSYKGHKKSAALPVVLKMQVPAHPHEELADLKGHLTIFVDKNHHDTHTVTCQYR